jgi:aminoglycoside phosphotransferase (APT) family kinase protein
MPAAEVDVDDALVRALLGDQHPDLAGERIEVLSFGWDNVVFRIGDELLGRFPRRSMAAALVEHELRWLPELAPRVPLAVPAPVRVGRPARGYPWSWSICPWFAGVTAAEAPPSDPIEAAQAMAAFLAALHTPAPPDAPANPYRGVPLAARAPVCAARVDRLHDDGPAGDLAAAAAAWSDALAAPPFAGPPVWIHGDLHPANLVVDQGRLVAVVDFGDLTAGDPATDLSVAWTLLPAGARPVLRDAYGGVDDATWRRARGWAVSHAIACLATSADHPRMAAVGAATLAAVVDDPPA